MAEVKVNMAKKKKENKRIIDRQRCKVEGRKGLGEGKGGRGTGK